MSATETETTTPAPAADHDQLAVLIQTALGTAASAARQSARYCAGIGDDATERALLTELDDKASAAQVAMWQAFYTVAGQ